MSLIPQYVQGHGLLQNKTVLITAAAGVGIGFATAKRCLEEQCHGLVISDIHEGRLTQSVAHLQAEFPQTPIFGIRADVSNQVDVDHLITEGHAKLGRIDVLVNNAGLGGSKTIIEMTDEEWHKVIDISLTGTFRMIRSALKVMIPNKKGNIINNASVLGWRAQKEQAHYAAAKAGVMALTRCAALEAAEHGIRINAVSPSIALHDKLKKSAPEELLKSLASKEAFGRAAEVWEIANVMIFLASDYSSYMTGEVVSVSSQHP